MNNTDEMYWCDKAPADFADELCKRLGAELSPTQLGLQQLLLRAGQYYYGALPWAVSDLGQYGPSSSFMQRTGNQGNQVTLKVNQARQNANAKHQIITNPALTWVAQAVNTDSKSMADAERGTDILENLWKQRGWEAQGISCVLEAIIFGESAVLDLWSHTAGEPLQYAEGQVLYAGDIRSWNVPTWDLFRDAGVKSYDESPWVCARLSRSKWELVAEYPGQRKEILARASSPVSRAMVVPTVSPVGPGAPDPDAVTVLYFFHRRLPVLPRGLQSVLLGPDLVLQHEPLSDCYADPLPVHRIAAADILNTPWAYSDYWDSLALQELRDDVESALATNIVAFGRQLLSVEEGQNVSPLQVANGPVLLPRPRGSVPPVPLQFTAQPEGAFEHLDALKRAGREVMGLNDFVVGQVDSAQMNAQYAALMASLAIQQNSDLQKRYVKFTSVRGRGQLKTFRANASVPRKVAIVGEHGPQESVSFTGKDFQALDDVYVTIGAPISQSTGGRLQIAQLNVDQGFVQTPEQLQQVVETGSLKPLTQGLGAELLYIAAENEALLRGEEPEVKITDSHQLHIREHRAPTWSEQARKNPQVNVASDSHIRKHLDFLLNTDPRILAAMGQAAPAPAAPPPGAAPGAQSATQPPEAGDVSSSLETPVAAQPSLDDTQLPQSPVDPSTGKPFAT